jgi:transposase
MSWPFREASRRSGRRGGRSAASNGIRDELEEATAVLDAFDVVKLGLQAMEETRRRVQQEQLGHCGRKHDPLYRIRNALRADADRLTARQIERIEAGLQAGDPTTK